MGVGILVETYMVGVGIPGTLLAMYFSECNVGKAGVLEMNEHNFGEHGE